MCGSIATILLAPALVGGERSVSRSCRFKPEKVSQRSLFDRKLTMFQSRFWRYGGETNIALSRIAPGPSRQSLYRAMHPRAQLNGNKQNTNLSITHKRGKCRALIPPPAAAADEIVGPQTTNLCSLRGRNIKLYKPCE